MQRPDLTLIAAIADELAPYRDEDEAAFWDSLDGETDALDLLDRFLASMQDDEALVGAIREQETALRARRDRIDMRAAAKKRALGQILAAAGMKKAERPRATVSIRPGSISVRITDEDAVPSQLTREKVTRAPDKAAIKAQLEAGEDVPGCELYRGPDIITVRVA
jgi:hypothetical protein